MPHPIHSSLLIPPSPMPQPKLPFYYDIGINHMFTYIRIDLQPQKPDNSEIALLLVSATKLMLSSILRSQVSYHSFTLGIDNLTIVIEDHTEYQQQNATKIAKQLERVYRALMARYGCGCGIKY